MKFFALLCIVGLAASSSPSLSSVKWRPGQQYTFDYEGRLLTGMQELAPQFSGLGLKTTVNVQVKPDQMMTRRQILLISVTDAKYVRVNDVLKNPEQKSVSQAEDTQTSWRTVKLPPLTPVDDAAKQLLAKPIEFVLKENGEIDLLRVSGVEPEWSVNHKKALAILFQTKFGGEAEPRENDQENMLTSSGDYHDISSRNWQVYEDGLDGRCLMTYTISQVPDYMTYTQGYVPGDHGSEGPEPQKCPNGGKMFEMKKVKDVSSCTRYTAYTFNKPGYFRCGTGNCEGQWARSSITRYLACGNTIEDLEIMDIHNEGELTLDLLGFRSETYLSGNRQILKLRTKSSISSEMSSPSQAITLKGLDYVYDVKQSSEEASSSSPIVNTPFGSPSLHSIKAGSVEKQHNIEISEDKRQKVIENMKTLFKELVQQDFAVIQDIVKNDITLKVSGLVRGFVVLRHEDIQKLYNDLKQTFSDQEKQTTFKNIFFDTLSMSGTVPAVRFVRETLLKKDKELNQVQMASIITFLPYYIQTPNELMLEELYQLHTSDLFQDKTYSYVHSQAIVSFSALIQKVCLAENRETAYPTFVYGKFCSPESRIVTEKWLPFLQTLLVKNRDNVEKTNVILVSLGLMSHKNVVSIVLPYVENSRLEPATQSEEQQQLNKLTRVIAINSLTRAGMRQPRLVARSLYSVFSNQAELPEVRIVAFNTLIRINAPAYYFQAIASQTWQEKDLQVLSIVNSAYFSLYHAKDLKIYGLRGSSVQQKIRVVYPLIKWHRTLVSGQFYHSDNLEQLGIQYRAQQGWYANAGDTSPTSFLSKIVYLLDHQQFVVCDVKGQLVGIDNLIQQIVEIISPSAKATKSEIGQKIMQTLSQEWRQVIQKLNIKDRQHSQTTSSALYVNNMEDIAMFSSLVSSSSEMLRQKISTILGDSGSLSSKVCGKHKLNLQKMFDFAPSEYIIPSDMGFPRYISVHQIYTPSLKGSANVNCGLSTPSVDVDTKFLIDMSFVGMVGTSCPFSGENVMTSVYERAFINVPVKYTVKYDTKQQQLTIQMKPASSSSSQDKFNIMHYHVKPFTVAQKVEELKPVIQEISFKQMKSPSKLKEKHREFGDHFGLHLKASIETESRFLDFEEFMNKFSMYNYNPLNLIRFLWAPAATSERGYPSARYHKLSLYLDESRSITKDITLKIKFGVASKKQTGKLSYYFSDVKDGSQSVSPLSYPAWQKAFPYAIEFATIGTKPLHQKRQTMLKEAFERMDVDSGSGLAFDASLILGGSRQRTINYRLSAAQGLKTMKQKWHINLDSQTETTDRICIDGHFQWPASGIPLLKVDSIRDTEFNFDYKNIIGMGSNCNERTVVITGNAVNSPRTKDYSKKSPEAKMLKQMINDNVPLAELSQVADRVRKQATTLDDAKFSVKYHNIKTEWIKEIPRVVLDFMRSQFYTYQVYQKSQTSSEPTQVTSSDWQLSFDTRTNTVTVTLVRNNDQSNEIVFKHIPLPWYVSYVFPLNALGSSEETIKRQPFLGQTSKTCSLDRRSIETFDKNILPVSTLDDCYHLISADCSYRKSYAIMAKTSSSSSSSSSSSDSTPYELKMRAGYTTIEVMSNSQVKVNNSQISVSPNKPIQIKDSQNLLVATIIKGIDNTIEVNIVLPAVLPFLSNNVYVRVLGGQLQIQTPNSLLPHVCGICGDASNNRLVDLRGPSKCVYSDPRILLASYRISEPRCSQLPGDIKQTLDRENQQCYSPRPQPTQVAKSFLKSASQCTKHIHATIENQSELCFSKRPIVECSESCKPESGLKKEKIVSFTCMSKSERVSQHYKEKILSGAILPELAGKPTDLTVKMELPKNCVPV